MLNMKKVFITPGSDFFCLELVFCCSSVAFNTLPSYWTGSRTDRDHRSMAGGTGRTAVDVDIMYGSFRGLGPGLGFVCRAM